MDLLHGIIPNIHSVVAVLALWYFRFTQTVVVAIQGCGCIIRGISAEPFVDVIVCGTGFTGNINGLSRFCYDRKNMIGGGASCDNTFEDIGDNERSLNGIDPVFFYDVF